MFVVPNSTIELFQKQPFDREHAHTVFFPTSALQNIYFANQSSRVILNDYTFLKEENETINIGLGVTLTYSYVAQCNYMRFKNTAFYDKWFYAFIDKVEMINIGCAKIYFTLDVMQTWIPYLDYSFEECFIERQHTRTDAIGSNIVDENIGTGDMIQYLPISFDYSSDGGVTWNSLSRMDWCIVIAAPFKVTVTYNPTTVNIIDRELGYYGIYSSSGLSYSSFPNTARGIADFMNAMQEINYLGKAEEIFAIFWYPQFLIPTMEEYDNVDPQYFNRDSWVICRVSKSFNGNYSASNIDGYTPRNNKLYVYPYNYLYGITPDTTNIYKYELFPTNFFQGGSYLYFWMGGVISPDGRIYMIPCGYKNSEGITGAYGSLGFFYDKAHETGFENSLSISSLPHIPVNCDLQKAMVAQRQAAEKPFILNAALSALWGGVSGGIGAKSGAAEWVGLGMGILGGAVSTAENIGNFLQRYEATGVAPYSTVGSFSGDTSALETGFLDFNFIRKSVRNDAAKRIDDYFTLFGYAIRETAVPVLRQREAYTYIKTRGCHIKNQKMPHDMEEEICQIMDKGITFWLSAADVGDYTVSNRPLDDIQGS